MQDFLTFKRMLTPIIIQILFWVGTVFYVVYGLYTMTQGGMAIVFGLLMVVFGPIFVRVACELIIIVFRIEENTRK